MTIIEIGEGVLNAPVPESDEVTAKRLQVLEQYDADITVLEEFLSENDDPFGRARNVLSRKIIAELVELNSGDNIMAPLPDTITLG